MKKIINILLIGLVVLSCKKEVNVPKSFDYGTIDNNLYSNTYFGFEFPVKTDWYVLDNQEADRLYEIGADYAAGDNKSLKNNLDATQINVAKLVSIFKVKPGTNAVFNPSLLINAENLRAHPDVNTPEKYLIQAKKLMSQSAMNIEYLEEKDAVKIGSLNFGFIQIKNDMQGLAITQDYYVALKNGFAISIIMSYTTQDDKKLLYEMFDELKI